MPNQRLSFSFYMNLKLQCLLTFLFDGEHKSCRREKKCWQRLTLTSIKYIPHWGEGAHEWIFLLFKTIPNFFNFKYFIVSLVLLSLHVLAEFLHLAQALAKHVKVRPTKKPFSQQRHDDHYQSTFNFIQRIDDSWTKTTCTIKCDLCDWARQISCGMCCVDHVRKAVDLMQKFKEIIRLLSSFSLCSLPQRGDSSYIVFRWFQHWIASRSARFYWLYPLDAGRREMRLIPQVSELVQTSKNNQVGIIYLRMKPGQIIAKCQGRTLVC